mgnify:FL=1|jgi:beta propeller repeat protein
MKKIGGGLMKTNKKLYSVTLASVALILFLILVPSAASAAPLTITETRITTSGYAHYPSIYGNRIIWDEDDVWSGGTIINEGGFYLYDFSTNKKTKITAYQTGGSNGIYENMIVWADYRNDKLDIYMYDASNKKETQISTSGSARSPAIFGNKVVWLDGRNGNYDIYMYDLSTKKETQITTGGNAEDPSIYNNIIVWTSFIEGGLPFPYCDVYMYDLSTKKETQILRSSASNLRIYGNKILWVQSYEMTEPGWGPEPDIIMYDISTKKITTIKSGIVEFEIYSNRIVWTNNSNIYMYDISTKKETQISTSGSAGSPAIYGDRIVWDDIRNEGSDIYMATLSSKPVAAFSASPTSGNVPLKVQFSDKSTGSPTSWKWNFGDGKTSTFRNPAYTYTKAGKYTVSLTVKNSAGTNTKTIKDYITVKTVPVKPVAAFSASPTSGYAPLKVTFTDKSANSPTSWKWSFGDGKTSTSKSPAYTYSKAGKYTVSLTVKNAAGSSTKTIKNYIVVNTLKAPVASFSAKPTSGKAPLNVQFTDKSSNIPTSWKWSFGDGTYSTAKNPVHKYSKVGKYTASLTVKNVKGSNTKTISNYIIVKK